MSKRHYSTRKKTNSDSTKKESEKELSEIQFRIDCLNDKMENLSDSNSNPLNW